MGKWRDFFPMALLLGAVLAFGEFSPEDIALLEKAKIGETVMLTRPAGDGCNTCSWSYIKTGEKTVKHGTWGSCTLVACPVLEPEMRFK